MYHPHGKNLVQHVEINRPLTEKEVIMKINSINQSPASSTLSPISTDSSREISSKDKTQLLRTTILSSELESELSSSKTLMEGISKLLDCLPRRSSEFPDFWVDMQDTFEEREGADAIEHEFSRDLSHLKNKGAQLLLDLKGAPDSLQKNQEIDKLTTFLRKENARIIDAHEKYLSTHHQGVSSNSDELSAITKNVIEHTSKLDALAATIQNSTTSLQSTPTRPR